MDADDFVNKHCNFFQDGEQSMLPPLEQPPAEKTESEKSEKEEAKVEESPSPEKEMQQSATESNRSY